MKSSPARPQPSSNGATGPEFSASLGRWMVDGVFAAEPENRIAREERGGGKTSVVGSPM